jgi:hypothetical protein
VLNYFITTQFGFRRNKSTTDVLITLENFIMDAIRKKEYTALLSLDISKAYDTCWRFGVLHKLKQWKIDGRILKFVSNFMSNRKLKVAVGNHYSRPKSIENGVVQGAVLSLILFLVAMADIVKDIKEPTQIMGYTDDWVVITSNKAPLLAENRLKKTTDSISKWAEENGFEISMEKTQTMLIHRRRPKIERRLKLNLFIKNERIKMVRQHRILGVIFDERAMLKQEHSRN